MTENNKICRMLSIDSSSNKTGVAVYENGIYIKSFVLNFEKEKDMDTRFPDMARSILNTIREYKPMIIYMEETVVDRNPQTQRYLSKLLGVVYGYCIEHDCEFNAMRPTVWRKLVGIDQGRKKRAILKKLSIEKVQELFQLELGDDEAEAILIGYAAIRFFEILEKKRKEVS